MERGAECSDALVNRLGRTFLFEELMSSPLRYLADVPAAVSIVVLRWKARPECLRCGEGMYEI